MKIVRALMTVVAGIAVLGSSSTAMAVTFQVEVSVGWINATGLCSAGGSSCLGFAGIGGWAGTSTRLNWDNQTTGTDSYLSIGALPDVVGFPPNVGNVGGIPIGVGVTTIDPGQTVRTVQIRHTNNVIPPEGGFLASITLGTLLSIVAPGGAQIIGSGTGGDLDVPVTLLETSDSEPCNQTSNSLQSICDDQFTFFSLAADIPFSFGGNNYVLQVRGLLNSDGTVACEDAGGGQVNCLAREEETVDRFVAITLLQIGAPSPVSAPATLLLLGLGLAGMGALPLAYKLS
jgi:hypothetical protein